MRKLMTTITLMFTLTLVTTLMTMPALATDYNVDGADPGLFGKETSVDEVQMIGGGATESDNINRSKDSAIIPPSFGSPASNTPSTGESLTPNISEMTPNYGGYTISSGSTYVPSDSGGIAYPDAVDSGSTPSYSSKFTLPDGMYRSDGSIGTLKIPSLSLTVKVYEEESLENLSKGAGHFKSTSCWDGNVAVAGHNRGVTNHFGQIHTLSTGAKITYTTVYGTRTYEVFYVGTISETDFTRLQRTDDNIITLITCVRDVPDLRWCVQARKVA